MLRRLLGINSQPHLRTYRGFGSEKTFKVFGHVSQDFKGRIQTEDSSVRQNILYFLRTYLARGISGEVVEVAFQNKTFSVTTGADGYFELTIHPHKFTLPEETEWITLPVMLVSTRQVVHTHVLIEGRSNTYGVISDIDDTVLVSNVANKIRLIFNTLTKNYFTRVPFDGAENWYQALVRGEDGQSTNPIFYVSSSHWNLYTFLKNFFIKNSLPEGPLLLKEFKSFRYLLKNMNDHGHKQRKIQLILDTYPDMQFVLIGDSSQHDPTLYASIALDNPGRIRSIYIRDVIPGRDPLVEDARALLQDSTPLFTFERSSEAQAMTDKRGTTLNTHLTLSDTIES